MPAKKTPPPARLHVEDNNGGDYLTLTVDGGSRYGDDVLMEVGHQCVVVARVVVPTAFLVMVLTDVIDSHGGGIGGVRDAVQAIADKGGWDEKFTAALISRVREYDPTR